MPISSYASVGACHKAEEEKSASPKWAGLFLKKLAQLNAARVNLSSDWLVEVNVQYGHCKAITIGCGFKPKDVRDIIHMDSAQCQPISTYMPMDDEAQQEENIGLLENEMIDPSNLELDPAYELDMEED